VEFSVAVYESNIPLLKHKTMGIEGLSVTLMVSRGVDHYL